MNDYVMLLIMSECCRISCATYGIVVLCYMCL